MDDADVTLVSSMIDSRLGELQTELARLGETIATRIGELTSAEATRVDGELTLLRDRLTSCESTFSIHSETLQTIAADLISLRDSLTTPPILVVPPPPEPVEDVPVEIPVDPPPTPSEPTGSRKYHFL